MNVSRETDSRLRDYAALLQKWTPKINLIAPSTYDELWTRHIMDSAQLFKLQKSATRWADLGSGAGLPGLVVAILAREHSPNLTTVLVESDTRKAAFCRTAARELDLRVTVRTERIENLDNIGADVVSARALAPLPRLLGYAQRHLVPKGQALFMKGKNWQKEFDLALESWRFTVDTIASETDPTAVILRISDIEHQ